MAYRVETMLTTPPDRCLQYDVREDEEQNVKLTECIDLLLAAGYFRARIKGLTPFDKVCSSSILVYTLVLLTRPLPPQRWMYCITNTRREGLATLARFPLHAGMLKITRSHDKYVWNSITCTRTRTYAYPPLRAVPSP